MPAPVAGVDGNWSCPQCSNINFAVRTSCNRCQAPAPAAANGYGGKQGPPPMAMGGGGKGGAPVAGVNGCWACPQCQNVNFAVRTECNRCQTPNPMGYEPMMQQAPQHQPSRGKGGPVAGVDGNWECYRCRNVNFAMRDACNKCQEPKPVGEFEPGADMWGCLLCQQTNSSSDSVCTVCQYPRQDLDGLAQELLAPSPHMTELASTHYPGQHAAPAGKSGGKGAPVAGVDGNWACPQCQNVNFAMRSACNRCQAQNPGASGGWDAPKPAPREVWPPQDAWGVPQPPGAGKGGAPVAGVNGSWACPQCQNVNFAVRSACNRCQAPKPMEAKGFGASKGGYVVPPQHHPQQWSGKSGNVANGAPVAGVDGNWACASCQNVNFAMREACNRCQAPKPYVEPHYVEPHYHQPPPQYVHHPPPTAKGGYVVMPPAGAKGGFGGKSGPAAGVDGNWACPSCQNVNYAVRGTCNRCQTPKPQGPPPGGKGGAPVAGLDGNWSCPQCRNVNFGMRAVCNRCQTPNPGNQVQHSYQPPQKGGKGGPVAGQDGNWACMKCSNVNFAMREACNRCQEPKPDGAYQDQSDADLIAQLSTPANDFEEPSAKRGRLY